MRPILVTIARHFVVAPLALAVSMVVCQFLGIQTSNDPRFNDISIALVVVFLISLHWHWLFGVKRADI